MPDLFARRGHGRFNHSVRAPRRQDDVDEGEQVRRAWPPRHRQGFTVFFCGLSGSGKSTIARALYATLLDVADRRLTLLDGDVIRKFLSPELGFSKQDRDANIRRIGFIAAEITKHGGVAICAAIAPYAGARREARERVQAVGGFTLVYLSTPLSVCEARDIKGLYAHARSGALPGFTGVSDPFEPAADAAVTIDTATIGVDESVELILMHLKREGYLVDSRPEGGLIAASQKRAGR